MTRNKTTYLSAKKTLAKILLVLIFFSFIHKSQAQNIIDTTGDVNILLLNTEFKVHTFRNGENLYAIARVYNVPIEQIFAYNILPDTIKPGTTIKIPRGKYQHKSILDTLICCLHKVKRHETITSIASKYGISPDLILKYNPQIRKKGLRRGKYIKIPEIKTPKDIQDRFFIYHAYRRGETPSILAVYYSIPVKDIQQFNPDSAFKLGKIIIIPKKHYNPKQISILRADYITLPDFTGLSLLLGQQPINPPCQTYKHTPDKVYKIAFLLPLFINENYFTLEDLKNAKVSDLYANTKYFYQFLFGAFIAFDELKQLGLNFHIYIYDTRNDETRIKNILSKNDIANMDLVIGPVYSSHFNQIRQFSLTYNISFVAPLTRKHSVIDSNPKVFLANPSQTMLVKRVADFLAPISDTANIIVLYNYGDNSQQLAQDFEKFLRKQAVENFGFDSLHLANTYFDPTSPQDYDYLFEKSKKNYVIIPVNNEVFVNGVLNYLSALVSTGYNITVFGMPTWEQFRNFDLQWFLSLKIHYPSAYYLDQKSQKVIDFREKYLATFHALPTYYSYLGYDITNYFAHALKQYGKTFQYCLSASDLEPGSKGIYMNFDFIKADSISGYENNAVFMLYYNQNLKLQKVDNIFDSNDIQLQQN